jgi:head-tail adaptor
VISAALLNKRITLILKQSFADDSGKMAVQEVFSIPCWACMEPVHRFPPKSQLVSSGRNTIMPTFKVYVRAIPEPSEDGQDGDRHTKVNALRWNRKEYELLCPFSISDKAGRFWEALCIEGGK